MKGSDPITAKEYLSQGQHLEQKIQLLKEEIAFWQALLDGVPASGPEAGHSAAGNGEALLIRTMEEIADYQERLSAQLEAYFRLKQEISAAIAQLEDPDDQLVLQGRYLCNFTWRRIADLVGADEKTARRWHNRALQHFRIPAA